MEQASRPRFRERVPKLSPCVSFQPPVMAPSGMLAEWAWVKLMDEISHGIPRSFGSERLPKSTSRGIDINFLTAWNHGTHGEAAFVECEVGLLALRAVLGADFLLWAVGCCLLANPDGLAVGGQWLKVDG